ncbi:PREDICTED: uncharacterized protein LOC104734510 [Camelina sativa]|uniref:Uncharacterized protein LOC104734510 n=1 Tax=Camelina sativa TaxID=90675 RepID=A0ABM0V859_CAMSA|nr:PREDICTED: uncharacterized protein LOC104734510 [Camelina sativa]
MEEETTCDDSDSDNSQDPTPEEIQLYYDEWDKSQGFEIDFSKLSYCGSWQPMDLDDTWADEPQTNRDFIARLSNMALTKHNAENGTAKVLRANFHPSAGITLYIFFEVNDPSDDANQTKPYRAVVRYLPEYDIEVHSCKPKPSS